MKIELGKKALPKHVKSIVILEAAPQRLGDSIERLELAPKRRHNRRSRGMLRVIERVVLGQSKAARKVADEYDTLHRRSNRKKRDGWLRDLPLNGLRAARKGIKNGKVGLPLLPMMGPPPPSPMMGPPPPSPMMGPLPPSPMMGPPSPMPMMGPPPPFPMIGPPPPFPMMGPPPSAPMMGPPQVRPPFVFRMAPPLPPVHRVLLGGLRHLLP